MGLLVVHNQLLSKHIMSKSVMPWSVLELRDTNFYLLSSLPVKLGYVLTT